MRLHEAALSQPCTFVDGSAANLQGQTFEACRKEQEEGNLTPHRTAFAYLQVVHEASR